MFEEIGDKLTELLKDPTYVVVVFILFTILCVWALGFICPAKSAQGFLGDTYTRSGIHDSPTPFRRSGAVWSAKNHPNGPITDNGLYEQITPLQSSLGTIPAENFSGNNRESLVDGNTFEKSNRDLDYSNRAIKKTRNDGFNVSKSAQMAENILKNKFLGQVDLPITQHS